MTDEDFDKVDQDFASEFDFVDANAAGGRPANAAAQNSGGPEAAPPKGSPIVPLLVLISVLGVGYYTYSHFFGKAASSTATTAPKPAVANNELPTLPEHSAEGAAPAAPTHAEATPTPTATPTATPTPTPAPAAPNPGKVAEALQPSTHSSEGKSFDEMQKEIQQHMPHPAQQAQSQQPAPQTVPPEVKIALQHISEEMTEHVNNIRQIENTINNVSSTLDNLNRTISAMDNRILSLTETVDGLSQDLANVKKVMVDQDMDLTMPGNVKLSSSRKQVQPISSTEPNYNVHAIIPGRAWLKSASGQIITVTEGDKVGDYGTVAVIDAANGLVRTSSGIIIR